MRPLVQGCTPLAPERKDPSLERPASSFLFLSLCTLFLRTFSFLSSCCFFLFFLSNPTPTTLFLSRQWRGACDQQSGTRRGLLLAPGTGASALTFRTIRELPVSSLRGVAPKNYPGTISSMTIERFVDRPPWIYFRPPFFSFPLSQRLIASLRSSLEMKILSVALRRKILH